MSYQRPRGAGHLEGHLVGALALLALVALLQTVPWMRRPDASLVHGSLARYGGPDGYLGPPFAAADPVAAARGGDQ